MNLPWYLLFKTPFSNNVINVIMDTLSHFPLISTLQSDLWSNQCCSLLISLLSRILPLVVTLVSYRFLACLSILLYLHLCIFLATETPNPCFCEVFWPLEMQSYHGIQH